MSLLSALCAPRTVLLMTAIAHLYGLRLLPLRLKVLYPALGWYFTNTLLRSLGLLWYSLLLCLHGAVALVTCHKYGLGNALVNRTVVFPLVAALVAGSTGAYVARPHKLLVLAAIALQTWSTLGGVVLVLCYPASVLQYAMPRARLEEMYKASARALTTSSQSRQISRLSLKARRGLSLDVVVLKRGGNEAGRRRWLMYFGGNAEFMETTLDTTAALADVLQANLVVFNHQGVSRSTGYVAELRDLVLDAAAVARAVMEREGVEARWVMFFGHSIGAAIAAQLVAHTFPEASLVIDRSFSRLSDAAVAFAPFPPSLVRAVFRLLLGDLDTVAAWDAIRHHRKLVICAARDEIIHFHTSSLARLPSFRRGGVDADKVHMLAEQHVTSWHNCDLFAFQENKAIVERLVGFFPT